VAQVVECLRSKLKPQYRQNKKNRNDKERHRGRKGVTFIRFLFDKVF
jgi:hypothetical protein